MNIPALWATWLLGRFKKITVDTFIPDSILCFCEACEPTLGSCELSQTIWNGIWFSRFVTFIFYIFRWKGLDLLVSFVNFIHQLENVYLVHIQSAGTVHSCTVYVHIQSAGTVHCCTVYVHIQITGMYRYRVHVQCTVVQFM